MKPEFTYILVDFFCIIFPLLFSFHPSIKFYKEFKYFALPCLISALIFIIWDIIFTELKVWSFNPAYVLGIYLYNLPIEEILFFICIPFACTFTFFCIEKFVVKNPIYQSRYGLIVISLASLLLVFSLFVLNKKYTCITFIFTGVFLIFLFIKKVNFLKSFAITYLIILIPFFISNGILTGNFTQEAVVIYDNNENLNIRLTTIPVEDLFYGMLLMLMNVYGYRVLRNRT